MAALNVNQITADLAMKSDKDLQSYAITNKGDPYLLALAVSESNRRKHLRAAQQAHTGQQAPKVVDQEVAQMAQSVQLPETVGIGSLPTPNMQKLAGGGIIAFEEGGHVPRFDGKTNGSQVKEDAIWDPVTAEWVNQSENPYSGLGAWFANKIGYEKGLSIDPLGGLRSPTTTTNEGSKKLNAERDAAMAQVLAGDRTQPAMQNDPRLPAGYTLPTGVTSDSVEIPTAAKTIADTGKGGPAAPAALAMPGANAGLAGLAAGKPGTGSALFQKEAMPTKEEYSKEYDTLYKALDEKNAKFLEGQKAKLKTDREEALYMSLIKGGLAAAGGTSKNALQNIAQGFGVGVEDFSGSLKEFRKAAQETAKAELEMDRAQADRRAGRMDKYDARMEKVKDRQLEADKAILSANTTLQHAGITAGATIRAAQLPPKEAQMAAMLGEGKTFEERFQSGLPKLTAIQAGKFDPRKAYTEYLVAAQRSGTGDIMPFAEFAMQFAPRVSGGSAGQVLERRD